MKFLRQCGGVILLIVMILLATVVSRRHGDNLIEKRTWKDTVMSFLQDDLKELEQEKIFLEQDEVVFKRERIQHQRANIERNADVKRYSAIALVASVCAALLLSSWLWGLAKVKAASVHIAKIGTSEIPVHERDIRRGRLAEQLTMLANAEQLRQTNAGQEHAFQIYQELAATQTAQLRALRGVLPVHAAALPAADPVPEPAALPAAVPTFRELLTSGEISPGKPFVFGVHDGVLRRGDWKDIYSNATGGESGNGKTATLRSLVAQSLLHGVQVWILDYHYPHPESLLASIGPLQSAVTFAEHRIDFLPILEEVDRTIDRRLALQEPSEPAKVLVIDEVLSVMSHCPQAARVVERIGTEGRKCQVYGLFSAQTWKADRVGGSTVRDNLTSIFAHRMKPKQADMLLQDSEYRNQVKKLSPGQALFIPTRGEAEILQIPHCLPSDMPLVADLLQVNGAVNTTVNVDHVVKSVDLPVDPENRPVDLLVDLANKLENKEITLSELSQQIGIDISYISKVLRGKKPMSARLEQKFKEFLAPENVIQGPWK